MAKSMEINGHEVLISSIIMVTPINTNHGTKHGKFTVFTSVSQIAGGIGGVYNPSNPPHLIEVEGEKERVRIVKAMRTGIAPDDDA